MKDCERILTKEEYKQAQEKGVESLFSPQLLFGYGVYSTCIIERDGQYVLKYRCGDSCD